MPAPKCIISVFCKEPSYVEVKQAPKIVIPFRGYEITEAEFIISHYHSNHPRDDAPLIPGFEDNIIETTSLLDLKVPFTAVTVIEFERQKTERPFYFIDQGHAESLTEIIIKGYDISKQECRYTPTEIYLGKNDRIIFNVRQQDYYEFLDNLIARSALVTKQIQHTQKMVAFKTAADQALIEKAAAERAYYTAAEKSKTANAALRQQEIIEGGIKSDIALIDAGLKNVIFCNPVPPEAPRFTEVILYDTTEPKFLKKLRKNQESKACSLM